MPRKTPQKRMKAVKAVKAWQLTDKHSGIVMWIGLERPLDGYAGDEAYWNYDPSYEDGWTFKANARLSRVLITEVTPKKKSK